MGIKYNNNLNSFAKSLRKNMTSEERMLWYRYLRNYPIKFYRQRIVGKYIADFYCHKAKLVIELDGSQHYEDKSVDYDTERTKYFEELGLALIRIPNNELHKNLSGVCDYIDLVVNERIDKPL